MKTTDAPQIVGLLAEACGYEDSVVAGEKTYASLKFCYNLHRDPKAIAVKLRRRGREKADAA